MKTSMAIFCVWFLGTGMVSAQGIGFVAAVFGDARLERQGAPVSIQVGSEIQPADCIITGPKGRVKVLLSDDSILALGSRSELCIDEHRFDPRSAERKTRARLGQGVVRALVHKTIQKELADFEIKAGNTVAGVRGTEFVLESDGNDSRLSTLSGEVEFSTADGRRVMVAAGQGSRIGSGAEALAAFSLGASDVERVRRETDAQQEPQMLAFAGSPAAEDRLGVPSGAPPIAGGSEPRNESSRGGTLEGSGTSRNSDTNFGGIWPPGDSVTSAWGNPVDGQQNGIWDWQWDNKSTVTNGKTIQLHIVLRK